MILLSEPIEEAGRRVLEGRAEVVVSPDPSSETVGRLLQDADALIVRTATQVTRPMIEGARRLKVISRTGGGLNNVDVEAATACGAVVAGVKGPQDRYVAEHTIALMSALAKQLPYLDGRIRKGNFKGAAALADTGIRLEKDVGEVIRTADFLSLHVPATAETNGFMNRERFRLMKRSAFFINTARGEIVQEAELIEALREGWIAGAGLDVLEKEPPAADNPLFRMDNVILTPHTAALTGDAVALLAEGAALNALAVLEGKAPSFSGNWEQVKDKIGRR